MGKLFKCSPISVEIYFHVDLSNYVPLLVLFSLVLFCFTPFSWYKKFSFLRFFKYSHFSAFFVVLTMLTAFTTFAPFLAVLALFPTTSQNAVILRLNSRYALFLFPGLLSPAARFVLYRATACPPCPVSRAIRSHPRNRATIHPQPGNRYNAPGAIPCPASTPPPELSTRPCFRAIPMTKFNG